MIDIHDKSKDPDLKKFMDAIKAEDDLGVVIRSHIFLELLINRFIQAHLTDPEVFNSCDFEYHQRVAIAVSLGLHCDLLKPLNFIGSLRNSFAHHPDRKLEKQDANNFYKCFSGNHKSMLQEVYNTLDGDDTPMKDLDPLSRFMLYATTIRAQLIYDILVAEENISDQNAA